MIYPFIAFVLPMVVGFLLYYRQHPTKRERRFTLSDIPDSARKNENLYHVDLTKARFVERSVKRGAWQAGATFTALLMPSSIFLWHNGSFNLQLVIGSLACDLAIASIFGWRVYRYPESLASTLTLMLLVSECGIFLALTGYLAELPHRSQFIVITVGCVILLTSFGFMARMIGPLERQSRIPFAIFQCRYDESDLSGVFMQGVILGSTSFNKSILSKANLRFAKILGCDMTMCSLDHVDLFETQIINSRFNDAIATSCNMTRSFLDGCDFRNCGLKNASFRHSIIHNTSFAGANVDGADFTGAIFENVDMNNATANSETRWPKKYDPIKADVWFPS